MAKPLLPLREEVGRRGIYGAIAFGFLSLAACSSESGHVWSTVPKLPPSSPVIFQQATGKLALAPVTVTLPERRSIGSQSRNVGCWVFVRQLTDADFPPGGSLTEPTAAALTAARLTVTPDPSGDVSGAGRNDYLLTANVAGVNVDMCNNTFMEDGPNDVDLQVDVAWKLWSVRDNRVVFETSTSGIGHSANHDQNLGPAAAQAMGDAAIRLLQTATVQQYLTFGHLALSEPLSMYQQQNTPVTGQPGSVNTTGATATTAVPVAPSPDALLIVPINISSSDSRPLPARVADAAVTVTAGKNAGSGVILSSAGYILTVDSLISDADAVSVTLASGQQIPAEIVRRDAADNVALLKITRTALPALPIEPRRPAAALPAYALNAARKLTKTTILAPAGPSAGQSGAVTLSLANLGAGLPVMDAQGSLLGLIIGHSGQHASMLPIGTVFRVLHLGASFEGE